MWESVVGSESLRGSSFVLLFTFDDKFKQMLESPNPLKDTKSAFAGFFKERPSYKACAFVLCGMKRQETQVSVGGLRLSEPGIRVEGESCVIESGVC